MLGCLEGFELINPKLVLLLEREMPREFTD